MNIKNKTTFFGLYFFPTLNIKGVPIIVGKNQNIKVGHSLQNKIKTLFTNFKYILSLL
jgi:hypothetical protein